MLSLNSIPTVYKHIYRSKVDDFLVLYNPYSIKGIALVDKRKAKLFDKLDGKKRLKDYLLLAKKLNINKDEFSHFISTLLNHEVINFEGNNNSVPALAPTEKTLILWVHLTEECNFRCTYCYVNKAPKRMSNLTVNKLIPKIYDLKRKHGFQKVNLHLGGAEPLLEFNLLKNIVQKVKKIEGKNQVFNIGIVTNGSLLTKEMAKYFKENNIAVIISLDGIGKYNDRTRIFADGSGTFKYIKKGVDIALKYKILDGIAITITSKNIDGLPQLASYCLNNNIKIIMQFYKKINTFCNETLLIKHKKIISAYKKTLEMIYLFHEKNKISHSPLLSHDYFELRNLRLSLGEHKCTAGRSYFSVFPDGTISLCASADMPLAKLSNSDFISSARKTCAPMLTAMSVNKIKECQSCLWKYICAGGCMLERLYLNTEGPTYKCEIYKALIPFILNLEARRIINSTLSLLSPTRKLL